MKYVRWLLPFILIFAFAGGAAAQTTGQDIPQVVNQAVADLSGRVGVQLTLNDIWQWQWSGDVYPDASMGCPQPGQTYAQVMTGGFQFLLTYGQTTYDYRVSDDGTNVILCQTYPVGTAPDLDIPLDPDAIVQPPVTDDPLPAVPPAEIACPDVLPSRLDVGVQAQVSPAIGRLNVRTEPGLEHPAVNQLTGSSVVNILTGPICDTANITWWQVEFDEFVGWAAEGRLGFYYMQPVTAPAEMVPDEEPPVDTAPDTGVVSLTCPELLPPRLEVDQQAMLRANILRLNIRDQPSINGLVVGQMSGGTPVTLLEGPTCGPADIVWWRVEVAGVSGWVAEGQDSVYFLEPVIFNEVEG